MKHLFYLFLTIGWLPCQVMAQQPTDVSAIKKQINEIKLDISYQKQEVPDSVRDLAEESAFLALLSDVNVSRKEKGLDSLLQKHLRPFVKILSYPRQSSYKGFAYVKIEDVDKIKSGIPFSKYFAADNLTSSAETQAPVSNQVVVPDKPLEVTTPPTPPTPPVKQKDSVIVEKKNETPKPLPVTVSMAKNQLLMSLSTMEVVNEVYHALEEFERGKSISAFGKMGKDTKLEENDYIVVFDSQRVVQSILQPSGNQKYINYITKSEDSLDNYRGTGGGALWFRF